MPNVVGYCLTIVKNHSLAVSVCVLVSTMCFFSLKANGQVVDKTTLLPLHLEKKIDNIINVMTLDEKLGLIHGNTTFTTAGVERLGISAMTMTDGPHGIRMDLNKDWSPVGAGNDSCTYLPSIIALGATWNAALAHQYGKVLGYEALARKKDMVLGPGVNIIRTPLNGRNFEYLSEDPWLTAQMAVPYIKGLQSIGTMACVKHFIANNQEKNRMTIDIDMTDRALHEVFLPAFKAAVQQAGVVAVMGAYNKFRGTYCTHNDFLVNNLLKKQWGFQGIMLSDWSAVHNTKEALLNGTDLEMGTELNQTIANYDSFYLALPAKTMIESGEVSVSVLNEKVRRLLRIRMWAKEEKGDKVGAINTRQHQLVAKQVAAESIVLLKNQNALLPIDINKIRKIAVIGAMATKKHAQGGGSSQVLPLYEITPLAGIQAFLKGKNIEITYAPAYEIGRATKMNKTLLNEAIEKASQSDVVFFAGGFNHGYSDAWDDRAFDSEDTDKETLSLPFFQDSIIAAIARVNANVVVMLGGAAPCHVENWIESVPALLQTWYGGSEGGNALAEILFGQVSPSGKLPVSFPKMLSDLGPHALNGYPGENLKLKYPEGVLVGYRFLNNRNIEPRFSFGFGLSYTDFLCNNARIEQRGDSIALQVLVKNIGKMRGSEVVQLYVSLPEKESDQNHKALKAFEKVSLEKGESKLVTLMVGWNDLRYFNTDKNGWDWYSGKYSFHLGTSNTNLPFLFEIEK